jgi:hypothetical protein
MTSQKHLKSLFQLQQGIHLYDFSRASKTSLAYEKVEIVLQVWLSKES